LWRSKNLDIEMLDIKMAVRCYGRNLSAVQCTPKKDTTYYLNEARL